MRAFLIGLAVAAGLAVGIIWIANVKDSGVAFIIGLGLGIGCPILAMWVTEYRD